MAVTFNQYLKTDGYVYSFNQFVNDFSAQSGWDKKALEKHLKTYTKLVQAGVINELSSDYGAKAKSLNPSITYAKEFIADFKNANTLGIASDVIAKPWSNVNRINGVSKQYEKNFGEKLKEAFLNVPIIGTIANINTYLVIAVVLLLGYVWLSKQK